MRELGYVIRYVARLDPSISFYRDLLGLPFAFARDGYAEFSLVNCKLGLFERARLPDLIGEDAAPGPPAGEILFMVDDVDREARRLREAGVKVLSGPVDRSWGHRTLHVCDPDGQVVELAQVIPRRDARGV